MTNAQREKIVRALAEKIFIGAMHDLSSEAVPAVVRSYARDLAHRAFIAADVFDEIAEARQP
jgi:RNA processing factor Prp31